ncbi:putative optic atrophy 3 protein -like protein [Capsicum annuum]|nr:uncharacterized protein LOC107878397 [Capsicum annuum]KAF3657698.1 putative optic atrophy 3 protein -like protein [Capsicum annuum]KAF3677814.1 putative optic atrophy 3 protein -like protein [Capsicum annuum]
MARTNKYTSLNFNDIYEKKATNNSSIKSNSSSSSSSSSLSSSFNNKTIISNSRIHGHMLVLSRPTPKPISIPIQQQNKCQTSPDQIRAQSNPDPNPKPDPISLRPQGRTGSGSTTPVSPLQKSNRFVPPHLRPGFVGREEKPVPVQGVRGRPESHQGSPRYGENGRPKSGGGYERMRRGFSEADSVNFVNRPSSSGTRPSSSG